MEIRRRKRKWDTHGGGHSWDDTSYIRSTSYCRTVRVLYTLNYILGYLYDLYRKHTAIPCSACAPAGIAASGPCGVLARKPAGGRDGTGGWEGVGHLDMPAAGALAPAPDAADAEITRRRQRLVRGARRTALQLLARAHLGSRPGVTPVAVACRL